MMDIITKLYNGELWSNYKSQVPKARETIYKNTRDLAFLAGVVGLAAGKYFGNKTSLFLGSFLSACVSIGAFTYQTYERKPSDKLKWPEDRVGLTEEQMQQFTTSFNNTHKAAGNGGEVRSVRSVAIVDGHPVVRRSLEATEKGVSIAIAKVPCTFELDDENAFLMPQKVEKTGSSKRKLRRCHDLYKDKAYVRKKYTSQIEKWFTKKLIEAKEKPRGIEAVLKIREVQTKKGVAEEIISESYEHTLQSFTDELKELSFSERLLMIQDLAHGLHFIHQQSILDGDKTDDLFHIDFRFFHSNIHPRHILIRKTDHRYEAALTDFRTDPTTLKCEFGYQSPETAKLYKEGRFHNHLPDELSMLHHNRANAQKRDVWQLGLIIIKILDPSNTRAKIECIEDALQREHTGESWYQREGRLGDIKQNDLQRSLHKLEESILPPKTKKDKRGSSPAEKKEHEIYIRLWQLAKKMLVIDPKERFTSKQVFDEVNLLVEKLA